MSVDKKCTPHHTAGSPPQPGPRLSHLAIRAFKPSRHGTHTPSRGMCPRRVPAQLERGSRRLPRRRGRRCIIIGSVYNAQNVSVRCPRKTAVFLIVSIGNIPDIITDAVTLWGGVDGLRVGGTRVTAGHTMLRPDPKLEIDDLR